MRCLLDSHTFLWFITDAPETSQKANSLVLDESVDVFISIVSFWEISIKNSLGKLRLDVPYVSLLEAALKNGFEILPVSFAHTSIINELPFHHRDPFDRMLIAQAIAENLDIIGVDAIFDTYLTDRQIKRIW